MVFVVHMIVVWWLCIRDVGDWYYCTPVGRKEEASVAVTLKFDFGGCTLKCVD